jgi:hypothetical protein
MVSENAKKKFFSAYGFSYCHIKRMNLKIFIRTGNKWLTFDKPHKDYPYYKIKFHYSSTARPWRFKQYSPVEGNFYQFKQCHIPQRLCQELQSLPFASSSPLTTKHSDRYVLRVAPINDNLYVWNSVAM